VVIHNLDVVRFRCTIWPLKAQSPLLVDPDAELSLSIPTESLKMVTRQTHQIKAIPGGEQDAERLTACRSKDWNSLTRSPLANRSVRLSR
jgi:hypothetical protein